MYAAADIDAVILDLFERGMACSVNLAAVRDTYIAAESRLDQ
jgi:hypothetical protein